MAEPEQKSEHKFRAAVTIYFPMVIAVLSLLASIYNGYLNNRFVTLIQGNVGRVEYLKTCRDIIDSYFQVKFRADLIRARVERDGAAAFAASAERVEAMNAVSKFGALGTYLANLRDDKIRWEYTKLSQELEKAIDRAGNGENVAGLFSGADAMFGKLNDDCIKSAHNAPM
jgi:hypothetical protein